MKRKIAISLFNRLIKKLNKMTAFEFKTQILSMTDMINAFAFKLTRDEDNAKDLTQETILKALVNYDKFRTNTNLKAWLKVIMKNTFINAYRKKSNSMMSYNSEDYRVMIGETNYYTPENQMMFEHIWKLIDKLDDYLKLPFVMHYEGYKYHEIAEKMNLPMGTVKSRIFSARKILSKSLNNA